MKLNDQVHEALEMRELTIIKFKRELRHKAGWFAQHSYAANPGLSKAELVDKAVGAIELTQHAITKSETFSWTPETVAKALKAAKKLPLDVPFHRAWLPVHTGYWWLGRNSPLKTVCETGRTVGIIDDDNPLPPFLRRVCSIAYTVFEGDFIFFEAHTLDHNESPGPTGFIASTWHEGETLPQFLRRVRSYNHNGDIWWNQAIEDIARFLMAGCLWLQQKVALVGRVETGSRHIRKRLKKLEVNTDLRVIHLRKYEQREVQNPGSGEPLKWRTLVAAHSGGFWRNQYYPSQGAHVPIWIDPFWRGPEDGPERAPSQVIRAVVR